MATKNYAIRIVNDTYSQDEISELTLKKSMTNKDVLVGIKKPGGGASECIIVPTTGFSTVRFINLEDMPTTGERLPLSSIPLKESYAEHKDSTGTVVAKSNIIYE